MDKYQIPLPIPSQGINLIDDSLISDNEAAEGTKNISFKNGIPHTRPGYIKASPFNFATQPHTLFNYLRDGNRYLLAACGDKLKKQSGDTFIDIGTLNSDVIGCLTYPCKFADPDVYSDKCFILDGLNYRYYNDGADLINVPAYVPTNDEITAYGTNVLSTTPDEIRKQRFILNDDERIWVAGYGKLVRISHLQRPDYFPSTQVWKLEEDCTAMAKFMGEVMLFTENTATLISGKTPNWNLAEKYIYTKLPGGYGCSNQRSVAVGDNAVYWANKSGIYRYRYLPTGFSIPECVSEFQVINGNTRSIKKWLDKITDWSKVHAQFIDHEYRLYIGNKQVIVFNAIEGTWALYEYDKEFKSSIVYDNTLYYASDYLYHMDYLYDPYGHTTDGLTDDGAAINCVLKSKFFDFGKAANKKKFKELYFTIYTELVSYNINLMVNMDNEYEQIPEEIVNNVARMGEIRFGDRMNFRETNLNYPVKIRHKGKKYNMQYELNLNQINMAFTLMSVVLSLKIKELK
jgi:hypothetical protein